MADLPASERYTIRQEEALPVVEAYFTWSKKIYESVLPKSLLGSAVKYSLNQERYLRGYLLDGRLESKRLLAHT